MRICGVGDNVVDRYPSLGLMFPGGNAVNVAVHAVRSGAKAAYVGVLGTDTAGDLVASSLRSEGVDVSRVRRVDGPNAYATVYLDEAGNRSFGRCEKGVSLFRLDEDDLAHLEDFDLIHLCETARLDDQVAAMADRAAVSYDFSDTPAETAAALLSYVDMATFSRPEATEEEVLRHIGRAHELGARVVIVTRGGRGAVCSVEGRPVCQASVPAEVVDTLGAGDAFIARFAVRLWEGATPAEAARDAAGYAVDVCGYKGGFGHARALV